jgi:NTE family protein
MAVETTRNAAKKSRSVAEIGKPIDPCGSVKTINLALQGGGAHGAFTWGVLDRLLEEKIWLSRESARPAPGR